MHLLIVTKMRVRRFHGNGQYNRAGPLFEQCLTWRKQELGEDHPLTIESLSNLANLFNKMAEYDRALPLFEEHLEKQKVRFGADSFDAKSSQMMRDECARNLRKSLANVYSCSACLPNAFTSCSC